MVMLRTIIKDSVAPDAQVSVVLLTYKRPHFLKESLKSLQANAGIDDYEILIWDNSKWKVVYPQGVYQKLWYN